MYVNARPTPPAPFARTGKVVDVTVTKKTDGTFVEAQLDSHDNDDMSPLGITANKGKGQGTFFYAIGAATAHPTADRVGVVRLPMAEKARHPRDDDDFEDGWDHQSHPSGWHESDADDDDDDGLENEYEYDSPTAQENVQVVDDAPTIAGGQYTDYTVTTTATSLALIAMAPLTTALSQC